MNPSPAARSDRTHAGRHRAAATPRPAALLLALALVLGSAGVCEAGRSLRFYGHGGSPGDDFVFPDRVKIDTRPPAAVNVGGGDFTIEFFMRALPGENNNAAQSCGPGIDWVNGNILIDRDRFSQGRKFGIALLGGGIAFGASDDYSSGGAVDYTLCGSTDVRDGAWHHVAVDRRTSDGRLRIWLDGNLEAEGPTAGGPAGDMAYPVSATPGNYCSPDGGGGSQSCENSDPFLVFGAEKHGYSGINFSGWLDEIRLSNSLRYTSAFAPATAPFVPDVDTAALYHFDEPGGDTVVDASGGGSNGTLFFGGATPSGPTRSEDSPFVPEIPVLDGTARLLLGVLLASGAYPGVGRRVREACRKRNGVHARLDGSSRARVARAPARSSDSPTARSVGR